MPVYIYQPDALDRMGIIEGERWMTHQCGDPEGMCSFNAFKRTYEEIQPYRKPDDDVWSLDVDGNGAIYGEGGWHRYAVRTDGEIIFLAGFCENPAHYRPLIEKAGFTVWGRWKDQK